MFSKHYENRRQRWRLSGFKNLLVWLIIYLMIGPFLENFSVANLLATTLLTAVLASAVYAVSQHNRVFYVGITLLTVIVILVWLVALRIVVLPNTLTSGLLILYLSILIYSFARISWRFER